MRKHLLPYTSLSVSEICLGTMIFGDQLDDSASLAVIDSAVKEIGINFLDTAELYPVPPKSSTMGRSDEIIGRWLKDNPSFVDQIVLASKVIAYSSDLKYFRGGPRPSKQQFRTSLEDTLKRLGVECLDLFQIHWPARNTVMFGQISFDPKSERSQLSHLGLNFHEQAEAMNDFIAEGKIKAWGLSNENSFGLMSFLKVCEQYDLQKPSTLQNAYSLLNRTLETDLREVCFREHVAVLPYSPLAMGHLSGKYLSSDSDTYPHLSDQNSRLALYPQMGHRYRSSAVFPAIKAYAQLADEFKMDLTTMALGYINQQPCVTSTIIGVSSREQLWDNMKSLEVDLSRQLIRKINTIHRTYTNPCP